jgi:hypothetical protein
VVVASTTYTSVNVITVSNTNALTTFPFAGSVTLAVIEEPNIAYTTRAAITAPII